MYDKNKNMFIKKINKVSAFLIKKTFTTCQATYQKDFCLP